MTEAQTDGHPARISVLAAVSNAMVALHKEQFGRGPTKARTDFAGPDGMVCVLHDALLPAERKMTALGQQDRVRDTRHSFQAATAADFIAAVEAATQRKVVAFGSSIDPDNNVAFENFRFEPLDSDGNGSTPSA